MLADPPSGRSTFWPIHLLAVPPSPAAVMNTSEAATL